MAECNDCGKEERDVPTLFPFCEICGAILCHDCFRKHKRKYGKK